MVFREDWSQGQSGHVAEHNLIGDRLNKIIYVTDYGAVGDGVTNDKAAFDDAADAADANGGIVFLPGPSVSYSLNGSMLFRHSNLTWKGVRGRSIIKHGTTGPLWQSSGGYPGIANVTFEDITFDLNGQYGAFMIYGAFATTLTFRHCRFINSVTNVFELSAANTITIEDCEFHCQGIPIGTAIKIQEGCRNIHIHRNRFTYMKNNIVGDTGSDLHPMSEKISITDNYMMQGWWYLKNLFTGSGGNVTYSAGGLSDSGASFSGLTTPNFHNVIALPIRESGSGASVSYWANGLTDTVATFVSAGIKRGEIVQVGSLFGIVKAVESETILHVEEWISATTYEVTGTQPASQAAYTVYGVIIGVINAFTGTTLTVDRWFDLDGTTATPTNGTLYEVLYERPNYQILLEFGFRDVLIANNAIIRGWSDQVAVYGSYLRLVGNMIEDGQDYGTTIAGEHNIIAFNHIRHQGTGGMFMYGDDTIISQNNVVDCQWVNNSASEIGSIVVAGNRNKICDNHTRRETVANGNYGIVLAAFTGEEDIADNDVEHNVTNGHLVSGFRCYADSGKTISNTRLSGNRFTEVEKATCSANGTFTFVTPLTQIVMQRDGGGTDVTIDVDG